MSILIVCSVLFKAWMFIDVTQRSGPCCDNIWKYVVLLIPFGDVAYFFAVKIHDPQISKHLHFLLKAKIKLEDVRNEALHCPSLKNKRTLACALYDEGLYEECIATAEEVRKLDIKDLQAKYVKGLALKSLAQNKEAQAIFEEIIQENISFAEYDAAIQLSEILINQSKNEEAIKLLESISRKSGRLIHSLKLVETFLKSADKDNAKEALLKLMNDYKASPRFIQRRDKKYYKQAKLLQPQVLG